MILITSIDFEFTNPIEFKALLEDDKPSSIIPVDPETRVFYAVIDQFRKTSANFKGVVYIYHKSENYGYSQPFENRKWDLRDRE